ncbi:hypothetical protein ASF88_02465 [Leifsonia sp. Leaf336]|uniref:hypothetical protein n=1 Tax=Leifsonia sp. Leaf336 TaxID=1736341 RepID=UPI0006F868DB|nr:hypothetical protein [Leifsonia sp. Leaf336]KQR53742.1 hypothetical protein ASF88_02465 [Leifsonia sp. Leaf336]
MGSTTTDRATFFDGLAAEFLQHYRTGPRFVAVTGVPGADLPAAADALADALRAAGQQAERAHAAAGVQADDLRAGVVTPFRSAAPDAVLVVDGPGLLDAGLRGFWNFSVWIEHDPERDADWSFVATGRKDPLGAPREVASVLFDDADPDRPRRLFADSC